jgi:uncharacterized protein YecT (DUF1311 family)
MLIRTIIVGCLTALAMSTPAAAATSDTQTVETCLQAQSSANGDANVCKGRVAGPCLEKPEGMSTPGQVDCLMSETKAWDDILNAEYHRLLPLLKSEAADDVKKAQRLWLQARDADCRVPYYFYDGGTIVKVLGAECERDHTADRAILIKNWREMAQGDEK